MVNVKDKIVSLLKDALRKEGFEESVNFTVEHPADPSHGDYASNAAMAAFSNSKFKIQNSKFKIPLELAGKIASSVQRLAPSYLERVGVAPPGFINFWLSKEYLLEQLKEAAGEKGVYFDFLKDKQVMVEFTDPNPFKEFHIGHLYTNTVGESISRILEASGAVVKRANYQGDVGMHIAKSLYGIFHLCHAEFSSASQILENKILKPFGLAQGGQVQDDTVKKRTEFLGKAYVLGTKAYAENETAKKEIEKLNKQIYEQDSQIMPLYKKGREWSLEYFETIYKRLGTKFAYYYFESEVGKDGLKLVSDNLKKGIFVKSNGAVIFVGKKQGLHNRVFINSQGLPTYETKELGLNWKKFQDCPLDLSIIITGNEINEYFKVLLAVMKKIMPTVASKTRHLGHGMVRLPQGKMSSRTGDVITGEWLLDEAKRRIKANFKDMDEEVLEKVAVGAVKYALLKSSIGRDITFSFEESISLEGNSGPYLQYTFARTQSVLAKVKNQKSKIKNTIQNSKLENEEMLLLRALNRFPEVVGEAAGKFAPNLLCNYLFDLAQKFNLFYQKHKIIAVIAGNSLGVNGKHPRGAIETQELRVALTAAVGQVIKNGLHLLGISAPEHM